MAIEAIEYKILTQQDIDNYPHKTKKKHGPWCKLCSRKIRWKRHTSWGTEWLRREQWIPNFIKVGEAVVKVTYRNHAVSYYHQECWKREKVD